MSRITVDPAVCHGKPCIRGHRIWVALILDWLAAGKAHEEILAEYPGLEELDIRACIAYGAELSRFGERELPTDHAASWWTPFWLFWMGVALSDRGGSVAKAGEPPRAALGDRL